MRAYLIGAVAGPFLLLAAAYIANQHGPESCEVRRDITFNGHLVAVQSCTGGLGLVTREPQIIARLD